jgi:paraquat-inducible protein A
MLLYVPANLFPIMSVVWLGQGEPATIIEGVQQLIAEGMWPLALIVFVASVFIPLLKMLVLALLLMSVQLGSTWRMRDRTRLYRITEFVGRWSMVDIFVIGILAALVQFGTLATIEPGIGSLSFAAVVVLTMFAAHSFDPRLIWDALND